MLSGGYHRAGPIDWKLALLLVLIVIIIGAFLSSCAKQMAVRPTFSTTGLASWYGPRFHGKRTASGERYNQNALTAAHKTLPFGTMVRVINLANDREIIVRINDRGPFVRGRIIDLSRKAAKELAMTRSGTARVRIESLETVEVDAPTVPGYKRIPNV